ncbi:MAG TPA: energy-coupling factor ABC transporter permease [Dissulfurispiraceae bacterium]|nr:energy-coupling factor ABC transporter permease [Dissulfurispiraceae bacterium]
MRITANNTFVLVGAVSAWSLLLPEIAAAMHIADGILPLSWAAIWYAITVPFIALGLRRMQTLAAEDFAMKPLVGLIAAIVFIVSCMPVPVPFVGTCSHPCGTAIAAVLLGPLVAVPVAFAALLLQALFLAHGGLSTLGANVLAMGVVSSFAAYGAFRSLRRFGAGLGMAGFCAGLAADWATYLTTSAELALGLQGAESFLSLFVTIAIAFVPTQLPLGILEGAMTAGVVVLLSRKRPDLLVKMRILKAGEVNA